MNTENLTPELAYLASNIGIKFEGSLNNQEFEMAYWHSVCPVCEQGRLPTILISIQ